MIPRRLSWPLLLLVGATVAVFAIYGWVRYGAAQGGPMPIIGQVAGFTLTNQSAKVVAASDLRGQVWVADLIFTRCPGPCLQLTRNLVSLQSQIRPNLPVRFVSLTADPEFDTPDVLRAYAAKLGADTGRWDFLTGPRAEINRLATEQLLLAVQEKPTAERETEEDLYLHSTKWVLIDAAGQIRAVYEGTDPGSIRIVARDIRQLLRERSS